MKRGPVLKTWNRPLRTSFTARSADRAPWDWYKIQNAGADETDVYIYDEIGWGWFGGVTAQDFVRELRAIKTSVINLHLNSPGGDVFEGITIANALRQHDATVHGYVDGLCASIATVIACHGCDDLTMSPHSTMMIHEAAGFAMGTAADMGKLAEVLNKISDNIAGVYADRAGGDEAEWRQRMLEETWLNDDEAVEIGLADRVGDDEPKNAKARVRFDLKAYGYQNVPTELLAASPKNRQPAVMAKPRADLYGDDEICILPGCQNGDLVDIDICREHLAALFELREPGEATEAEEMAQSAHAAPVITNAAGDDCCPCCEERACSARACDGMCDEGEDCCDEMDDRQATEVAAKAPAPTLAMSQFTQIMREAMASR